MKRVHTVHRPDEFKALADPRRIEMLGWLAREPLTVTQLAERLGELPATVHHHVKMLERAGLARITLTREKSGILEKYYQAVAERIVADQDVGQLAEPAAIALDAAASALRAGLNRLDAGRAGLAHIVIEELKLTRDQAGELVRRLQEEAGKVIPDRAGPDGPVEGESWMAVIALYPVSPKEE